MKWGMKRYSTFLLITGRMCKLCATDRALEQDSSVHMWHWSLQAHLHLHQQRLEGWGVHMHIYTHTPTCPHMRPIYDTIQVFEMYCSVTVKAWWSSCLCVCVQEYLFRLVPGYVDSGKGKCPYDPRQENAAVLISESSLSPSLPSSSEIQKKWAAMAESCFININ